MAILAVAGAATSADSAERARRNYQAALEYWADRAADLFEELPPWVEPGAWELDDVQKARRALSYVGQWLNLIADRPLHRETYRASAAG